MPEYQVGDRVVVRDDKDNLTGHVRNYAGQRGTVSKATYGGTVLRVRFDGGGSELAYPHEIMPLWEIDMEPTVETEIRRTAWQHLLED